MSEAETTTETTLPDVPEKLRQDVQIETKGPCLKHVTVSVERGDIDDLVNTKFDDLLKERDAVIPGFRPGKVPRKLIEKKFRKSIMDDVRREILMVSLQQLAEDTDLAPLAPPDLKIDDLEIPEEGNFIYEFDVEVRPDFTLPDLNGIKLDKYVREFTDEDVQKFLQRELEPFSEIKTKDGSVELGDIITFSLTIKNGDKVLNDVKTATIRVESRLALADGVAETFADALKGAKVGDTRSFPIKVGTTAADPELRGKTLEGSVTLQEVKQVVMPAITPAILENFGVRNEAQLTEKAYTTLERNHEELVRRSYRAQILKFVTEKVKIDLPEQILRNQASRVLGRQIKEMQERGLSENTINSRIQELSQDAINNTATTLMQQFVLQKVADDAKIEVEEKDIDAEIERLADRLGVSARAYRAKIEQDQAMEMLAANILENRALDLVLNNAVYNEVSPTKADAEEESVSSVAAQAIPGELYDPTAPLPEAGETPPPA